MMWVFPLPAVHTSVCACVQMSHACSYPFDTEATASIYFPPLNSFQFPHCSQRRHNPVLIRKTFVNVILAEEADLRKVRPVHGRYGLQPERASHTWWASESSVQELLPGRTEEARIGYSVASLVNMLCAHIPFPFLPIPSPFSHSFGTQDTTLTVNPTPLASSLCNLPTNVRTLPSWGVDSKGNSKTKNSK